MSASRPIGGKDYPRHVREFEEWFPDDAACRAFLEKARWPRGFVCPACGHGKRWEASRGRLVCASCRHQTSVTAGTIMEKTRIPLRIWFHVMWTVAQSKNGVSALSLKNEVGFGSYETAWTWLHKLRRAMVRPDRDTLRGEVEVDETYVGGHEEAVTGRETLTKSIVVIAVERRTRMGAGRVRMQRIPGATAAALIGFVKENIAPGAVIHTDAWNAYHGLKDAGYDHRVVNISKSPGKAHEYLPLVHRVAALLKRWLLGTHQGSVSGEQLDYYLDEYTFRFNRRTSRARGLLFYRLVQQAMNTDPAPYDDLTSAKADK